MARKLSKYKLKYYNNVRNYFYIIKSYYKFVAINRFVECKLDQNYSKHKLFKNDYLLMTDTNYGKIFYF